MIYIGISGKKGSGKDTFGGFLLQNLKPYAYKNNFATPLKFGVSMIFKLDGAQLDGNQKEVVDPYWQMTPREILQRVGTECFRKNFGDDFWCKVFEHRVETNPVKFDYLKYVIACDARFPSEANFIKSKGGILIRIERNAVSLNEFSQHESETALDTFEGWDFVVPNNGSLEDLALHAKGVAEQILERTAGPR
jgi:hypothetical protein